MNSADKKFASDCYEWLDKREMTDEAWEHTKQKISQIGNPAREEAIFREISDLHFKRHPDHFFEDDCVEEEVDDNVADSEEDEEGDEVPDEVDIGGFDLDQFAEKGTIKDPEAATKAYLEWLGKQKPLDMPTMRLLEKLVEFEKNADKN